MKTSLYIKKSVKDIAYVKLKDMIVHHILKPNAEIREEALAESLLVSRTPLRAAMQQLVAEELLVRQKNGRLIVADITPKRVQEIFELRAMLEGYVVRIATTTIEEQQIQYLKKLNKQLVVAFDAGNSEDFVTIGNTFHEYLWQCSSLQTTISLLQTIKNHVDRFCYYVSMLNCWDESSIQEHEAILEAIELRNPILAEQRMQQHIHNSLTHLIMQLQQHEQLTNKGGILHD